jgi:hypothetical protein
MGEIIGTPLIKTAVDGGYSSYPTYNDYQPQQQQGSNWGKSALMLGLAGGGAYGAHKLYKGFTQPKVGFIGKMLGHAKNPLIAGAIGLAGWGAAKYGKGLARGLSTMKEFRPLAKSFMGNEGYRKFTEGATEVSPFVKEQARRHFGHRGSEGYDEVMNAWNKRREFRSGKSLGTVPLSQKQRNFQPGAMKPAPRNLDTTPASAWGADGKKRADWNPDDVAGTPNTTPSASFAATDNSAEVARQARGFADPNAASETIAATPKTVGAKPKKQPINKTNQGSWGGE